jgi:hypothetical protein
MGNNTSTEEKVGGGFLTGLGIILAFTPAGPFTSTWMIPAGGAIMTGKDQSVGVGITYADDGNGIQPFTGIPEQASEIRQKQVDNEIIEKNKKEYQKNTEKERLNSSIKYYSPEYETCFKKFKDTNISVFKNSAKITTYEFVAHKGDNTQEMLNKFGSILYWKNDDPEVSRIYVIRRKLDSLPIYLGWFAHSGLLLKTKDGRYFVCEYGTEKDQNVVSLYEIKATPELSLGCKSFEHNGRKWHKQISGSDLPQKASISSIQKTMESKVTRHNYSMLFWNCHMAQEATRKELGLKVTNEYLDKKYYEEYELMHISH